MSKSRPTHLQMITLVDLMAKDPLLCAGKFSQTFTHKIAKKKWEMIAVELNALPGAEKSWEKWKKTWHDTRSATKTKAAAIKRHIGGTGGGPSCSIELNEVQQDTLSLICPASVSGHVNSTESNIEFVFDVPNDVTVDTNEHELIEEFDESYVVDNQENYLQPSIVAATLDCPQPSSIAAKSGSKKKTTTMLNDSTAAAIRLGDIAESKLDIAKQKLAMKSAYYDKKIILKEENNVLLRTLISTLNEKLPRT